MPLLLRHCQLFYYITARHAATATTLMLMLSYTPPPADFRFLMLLAISLILLMPAIRFRQLRRRRVIFFR